MPPSSALDDYVRSLPGIYQPIYGHPDPSDENNANVESRFASIKRIYDTLSQRLGRPLKVLDLGCGQGWFSFSLAAAGANIVGLDRSADNINVCNMLLLENIDLTARFKTFMIENVPDSIPEGQFDLFLGLSVFHHICYFNGQKGTQELLRRLFAKIPSGICEFALSSEATKIAASVPDDPEFFIDHVPFRAVISSHTHPAPAGNRPIYFCSTKYKCSDGVIE